MIRYLFWLFAAAIRAERTASHELADFYWAEAHSRLSAMASSAKAIGTQMLEVAAQVGVPVSLRPEQINARFVDEVAIDTHAAFYNLLSQDPPPFPFCRERAATHLARIKSLLPWSGMNVEQQAAFLHPATLAVLTPLREAKRWPEVAAEYRELLSFFPEDREIQLGLIDALWEQGAAEPPPGTTPAKQVSQIKPLIAELESLSSKLSPHPELFNALGELNVVRTIAQAKSGDIPEALLSVEKALAARPDWEAASSLKQQLHEALVDLRKQAAILEKKLRMTPNAALTSDGIRLKRNAKVGDRLAKEYAESAVARDTRKNSKQARDRRFWRNIGLHAPRENFEDSHVQLVQSLASVLDRQPGGIEEISALWEQAASTAPALQSLDPGAICRFLAHKAYGAPWEPANVLSAERPASILAPPAIALEAPRKQRVKPKEWILGRQDVSLKLTITAAAIMCIAAVGLVHRENQLVGIRAAASSALQTALERHDDISVMKAAHDYLSAHPVSSDGQEAFVKSAYQKALVHWAFDQASWEEQQQAVINQFRGVMPAGRDRKQ